MKKNKKRFILSKIILKMAKKNLKKFESDSDESFLVRAKMNSKLDYV